jgi:hypothetical protein
VLALSLFLELARECKAKKSRNNVYKSPRGDYMSRVMCHLVSQEAASTEHCCCCIHVNLAQGKVLMQKVYVGRSWGCMH